MQEHVLLHSTEYGLRPPSKDNGCTSTATFRPGADSDRRDGCRAVGEFEFDFDHHHEALNRIKQTYDFSLLKALPLRGIAVVLQRHRPWREVSHWRRFALVIATCIPTLEYVGLRLKAKAWSPIDQWDGPGPYQWYHITGRTGRDELNVKAMSEKGGILIHTDLLSTSRDRPR